MKMIIKKKIDNEQDLFHNKRHKKDNDKNSGSWGSTELTVKEQIHLQTQQKLETNLTRIIIMLITRRI
jgi:hypothetical protein